MKIFDPLRAKKTFIREKLGHTLREIKTLAGHCELDELIEFDYRVGEGLNRNRVIN